jgi:hypothetical protein
MAEGIVARKIDVNVKAAKIMEDGALNPADL